MVSLDDYLAIEDLGDDWLLQNLIPFETHLTLYGGSGSCKSILAFWMALHVASGRPLEGREVQQGPVLIIEEDSGGRVTRRYLRKQWIGGGFPKQLPIWVNPKQKHIRLNNKKDCQKILDKVEEFGPKLVILDATETLVPATDHKSGDYAVLEDLLDDITERHASVILIDHTKKGNEGAGGKKIKNDKERIIGAQRKNQMTDFAIELNGNINRDGVVHGVFTKERDIPPPKFDIYLCDAADKKSYTLEVRALAEESDLSEHARTIKHLFDADPQVVWTTAEIAERTELSASTVKRMLKELLANAMAVSDEQRDGRGRSVTYRSAVVEDAPIGIIDNDAA